MPVTEAVEMRGHLIDSGNFSRLLDLNLLGNHVTDRGGEALIESPHLPRDLALQIDASNLSPGVREALRRRFRAVNFGP